MRGTKSWAQGAPWRLWFLRGPRGRPARPQRSPPVSVSPRQPRVGERGPDWESCAEPSPQSDGSLEPFVLLTFVRGVCRCMTRTETLKTQG